MITRLGLAALALIAALPHRAAADEPARIGIVEENDSLYFRSDKHYTQGIRFSYATDTVAAENAANRSFELIAAAAPFLLGGTQRERRLDFALGQSIFTPKALDLRPPDRHDRPYAGWLYAGGTLLQQTDGHILDAVELELGIVGPAALGKQIQNNWHQLIGKDQAQGWSSQLQNEPGILVSYDRLWRVPLLGDERRGGVDIVPQLGASLGNIFTYGEVGGIVRAGRNLQADYGAPRIRPGLSGTDWFDGGDLDGRLGYYVFAGLSGRAVGQNIFLDGNSFRASRSVPKKALVGDLEIGFTLFWSRALRVDFTALRRTEEFDGQAASDVLGTAALSFSW